MKDIYRMKVSYRGIYVTYYTGENPDLVGDILFRNNGAIDISSGLDVLIKDIRVIRIM